ncbi:MAG TPA: hypothetical protein VF681_02995 [Abditibacteriaceae bacterium]|jgi:hypothetical protein
MAFAWEYLGKQELPPGGSRPWTVETWRARVEGGWMIMVIQNWSNGPEPVGLSFMPDPSHSWNPNALADNRLSP